MQTAPYGSWVSPISAAMLAEPPKFGGYGPGIVTGESKTDSGTTGLSVIAAKSDPAQGGRVSLWRLPERTELTPNHYVRSAIHEYGGGEWTAAATPTGASIVVYTDFPSNDLRIIANDADRLLAPGGAFRYGGLTIDTARNLVLAVREDCSGDGEPTDAIIAIPLGNAGPGKASDDAVTDTGDGAPIPQVTSTAAVTPTAQATPTAKVLVTGADFYASPSLSPDGRQLAWVEWQHPNMPWDTTSLKVAPLPHLAGGTMTRATAAHGTLIAGGDGSNESVLYPTWAPDGSLVYLSDSSGFWNFHRYDGEKSTPLHVSPYDFTHPMWVLDAAPYTIIRAENGVIEIGCTWLQDGISHLGVLCADMSGADWELTEIPTEAVAINLSGNAPHSTLLLSYWDRPSQLATINWQTREITPLPLPEDPAREQLTGYISKPEPISWEGQFGIVHGWYYPPTNKDFSAPDGELPPLQVLSHGGPTSLSMPTYSLGAIQYWTSRGIGVLDVNYSGSSGYGRAYRERLKGNWGIADVADCAAGAQALVERGLADPARIAIKGGSAGGFTTLASLAFTDVYGAGISLYGIGDLEILAKETHKFESRYLDGLVGPYPASRSVYLERSPNQHLDQLSAPMLILQGLDDAVVPPSQAYAMSDAVRAKGLPVTLITYGGEGHGFRKAETIINSTESTMKFLGETFNFTPALDAGK